MSQNAEKLHQDRFGADAIPMLGGEWKNEHQHVSSHLTLTVSTPLLMYSPTSHMYNAPQDHYTSQSFEMKQTVP